MPDLPLILFGAFDRHNFGDLLMAEISASVLQQRPLVFAGLAQRDLSAFGGREVRSIAEVAREWGEQPADVVHTGGEVLTCSLYEAAVMLLSPEAAALAIACHDRDPEARQAWSEELLGLRQRVAYLVPRSLFRHPRRFQYFGIGGTGLATLPIAMKQEVFDNLRHADHVWVRDRVTQVQLEQARIRTFLAPDPATATVRVCGSRIAGHRVNGEPAAIAARFARGYLAAQFSAEFGDDATLREIGCQLQQVQRETGLGIVLFRAGAAPWHDDLDVYRRLLSVTGDFDHALFQSLDLWDICALLANATAYCGSSLHGRIVAEACGRPAANLIRDAAQLTKQAAHALSWGYGSQRTILAPADLAIGITRALQGKTPAFDAHVADLADLTMAAFSRAQLARES
ncbi:MAG: polysaccharide pyruvyl transferase family protein [Xanthomonadales bacterium]|nr:polysaccharide pyruvyl transferase family protein [Xanthomonadales bacterium]